MNYKQLQLLTKKIIIQFGYDILFCNKKIVRREVEIKQLNNLKISVAIPNYNRGHQIHRALKNIITNPIVNEIIILDDSSHEDNYSELNNYVKSLTTKKIKIYRNEQNCKALVTKRKAVSLCQNDWVLLLDSDNTAFNNYLELIQKIKHLDVTTIYCASVAFPYYSFQDIGFDPVDFDRASHLASNGTLSKVYFFNDGNYLVPKNKYVEVSKLAGCPQNDSADVMLFNYFWVSGGGRLQILKNSSYMHRIDNSSRWLNNPFQSKSRVHDIINKLKNKVRAY